MDDAWTRHVTARRQLLEMKTECIRQRSGMYSGGRMYHEPGGFVNYRDSIVFVDNFERYVFRCEARSG